MTEADREEFSVVIAAVAATFRQEATEALYQGYWLGLSDLALDAVKNAAAKAIRQCRFMPTVVELRRLAGELSIEDRAARVWQAVRRAVLRHGYYGSVSFDDPLTNATIRSLGDWRMFCVRMEEEDEKWTRKEFERVYAALARAGVSQADAAPLIGEHERHNTMHGYLDYVTPPVVVSCGLPAVRLLDESEHHTRLLECAE